MKPHDRSAHPTGHTSRYTGSMTCIVMPANHYSEWNAGGTGAQWYTLAHSSFIIRMISHTKLKGWFWLPHTVTCFVNERNHPSFCLQTDTTCSMANWNDLKFLKALASFAIRTSISNSSSASRTCTSCTRLSCAALALTINETMSRLLFRSSLPSVYLW